MAPTTPTPPPGSGGPDSTIQLTIAVDAKTGQVTIQNVSKDLKGLGQSAHDSGQEAEKSAGGWLKLYAQTQLLGEALHGVARAGKATVFPQAIGLAASWDTDMMRRVATVISDEARAKHHDASRKGRRGIYEGLTFWSPNINIFRDPRWGRGMETYGEDPYLTGRLGVQFVKGMQGDDPKYLKTISTPKHFAVHSGPEPDRHVFDAADQRLRI